jgi:hypothetical protein
MAVMTPIDVSKIILYPLITLHLIADTGAMIATGVSKLPLNWISMSASLIYNTSFKQKKLFIDDVSIFKSVLVPYTVNNQTDKATLQSIS